VICSLPACQGGIFIEGWHRSSGANLESYVLDRLKKSVYEYDDIETDGDEYTLTLIERDKRIAELNDLDDVRKAIAEYDNRRSNGRRPVVNVVRPQMTYDPLGLDPYSPR
jgi:hypothetical protein